MKKQIKYSTLLIGLVLNGLVGSIEIVKAQGTCPSGATWCTASGSCIPSNSSCPPSLVPFVGDTDHLYALKEGTIFTCKNGNSLSYFPESPFYFACSENHSLVRDKKEKSVFNSTPGTIYVLPSNLAFACSSKDGYSHPIKSPDSIKEVYYVCPLSSGAEPQAPSSSSTEPQQSSQTVDKKPSVQ